MTTTRLVKRVLVLSAHPDDAELGCGGTLIKHVQARDCVTLLVVTTGNQGPGSTADRVREQERAVQVMGINQVVWGGFPDCEVSLHERDLVHKIEQMIRDCGSDLIYTHSQFDSHQDHRSVAFATLGAARQHRNVLSYDSPSSLCGFQPNVFVDISETIDKKIEALRCHASQVEASEMVSCERVRNVAGFRGGQARVDFAEAFAVVRHVMDI